MSFTVRKSILYPLAGAAFLLLAGTFAVRFADRLYPPPADVAARKIAVSTPASRPATISRSLYCVFYDFTHASIVVGFNFAVDFDHDRTPRFFERTETVRSEPQVTFDKERPAWSFDRDEDGTPTIASPDGATRILLYGLKLDAPGILLIDAGIRSNDFRNLDGQCRQAFFGGTG